jgi:hypothetical protein
LRLLLLLVACSTSTPVTNPDLASSGAACNFNADCPGAERCHCDETAGCACESGARGSGRSGVDVCSDGDACATSLCVEGMGGVSYCSGPCSGLADCGAQLPRCVEIAPLGPICIR